MAKVAIITDLHFGVRKDDNFFMNKKLAWLENQFFPTLKEHNIDFVLNLGDTFDNRVVVNVKTLNTVKDKFIDELYNKGITMISLLGNHDVFHKNNNDINTMDILANDKHKIVRNRVVELTIDGWSIGLVPWVNSDNYEDIVKSIKSLSNLDDVTLLGHFQIEGIPMVGGKCASGLPQTMFKGFTKVLSGHFHNPSLTNNIWYIGNPFYDTWSDYGQDKGFYIYDTETKEYTHIPTEDKVYHVFNLDEIKLKDYSDLHEQIVKIYVNNIEDNKSKVNSISETLYTNGCKVIIEDLGQLQDAMTLNEEIKEEREIASKEFVEGVVREIGVDNEDDVVSYMLELLEAVNSN